ncbi:High mobility group (HMG) box domain-containing protein [Artemisia annua]|uniref:High mobility group (HMG) box domain-containing protein n=1 Tax=Artemisia annua TaxID=35608 RepID=A0A2U1LND1_ARTAN|nr:High mobility group (HMG) box domain-containing protein [Artemisia annua]
MQEGVTSKDEAQNCVFVDPCLVCPEVVNSASVAGDANVNPGNLDGKGEADKMNKKAEDDEESDKSKTEVDEESGQVGKRKAPAKAAGKSKAAKKAAKDPNKPKKPPSAFFVFLEEFRKTFKKENPTIKAVSAVGKAGGEKWKFMSAADKAPYEAKAAKRSKNEIIGYQVNYYGTGDNVGTDEVKNDADMEAADDAGDMEVQSWFNVNAFRSTIENLIAQMFGRICLTIDLWNSNNTTGYIFITGRFIDSEWNIHKRLLKVVMEPYPESDFTFTNAQMMELQELYNSQLLFTMVRVRKLVAVVAFATLHGGPAENIVHGKSGFHINPYHGDQVTELLVKFFEKTKQDPSHWDAISKGGLQRIQ